MSAMTVTSTYALACRNASTTAERELHYAIRRQVFVTEQGIFDLDDRDSHDDDPAVVHVVGYIDGAAAGAVRLYPLPPESEGPVLWQGDRLAVLPEYRRHRLGGPLVRHAVQTAGQLGGETMLAHVQLPNVRFFQHLGWTPLDEPELYQGVPHQRMSIGLDRRVPR